MWRHERASMELRSRSIDHGKRQRRQNTRRGVYVSTEPRSSDHGKSYQQNYSVFKELKPGCERRPEPESEFSIDKSKRAQKVPYSQSLATSRAPNSFLASSWRSPLALLDEPAPFL